MGIKNVLQSGVIFVVVCVAVFGTSSENAIASEMKMRQRILPVRFVYLEKDGSIDRIWSNVRENDDEYIVKFFDTKQKEVSPTKLLLDDYQLHISREDKKTAQLDKSVHFNEQDEFLEEVHTAV